MNSPSATPHAQFLETRTWLESLIPLELYRTLRKKGTHVFQTGNHFFQDQEGMSVSLETGEVSPRGNISAVLTLNLLTYRRVLHLPSVMTSGLDITGFQYDDKKQALFSPFLRTNEEGKVVTDSTKITFSTIDMDSYDYFIDTLTQAIVKLKVIFRGLTLREDLHSSRVFEQRSNVQESVQGVLDYGSVSLATIQLIPDGIVNIEDVGLSPSNKKEIDGFLKIVNGDKKSLRKRGVVIPKGYLFRGPPGVGKTELMRALSNEAGILVYKIDKTHFDTLWKGVGPQRLEAYLELIAKEGKKQGKHAIIFIDEADGVLRKKERSHNSDNDSLNVLLKFMDGIGTNDYPVTFFVATNVSIQEIEPSAIRSGRLGRHITMELPSEKVRAKIIETHLERKRQGAGNPHLFDSHIDMASLLVLSRGFNGADIRESLDIACQNAYLRGIDGPTQTSLQGLGSMLSRYGVKSLNTTLSDEVFCVVMEDIEAGFRLIKKKIQKLS